MLFPLLATFLILAGLGGWLVAKRAKHRRYLWLALWSLVPLMPYLAFGLFGLIYPGSESRESAFGWWLIGFGYIGLPILVWAGASFAGFLIGHLRDDAGA